MVRKHPAHSASPLGIFQCFFDFLLYYKGMRQNNIFRSPLLFICLLSLAFAGQMYIKTSASEITNKPTTNPTTTPSILEDPTPRIGLQAGHWKNTELPDEFINLRLYGGGATVGAVTEWEVNLKIAQRIAAILKERGVIVDLLPATIPPGYKADLFVSIHADGNEDASVTGFRVAPSELDLTGKAEIASEAINTAYATATGMKLHPNISEDMTRYYAFNFPKFEHVISQKTPGVIVETGFLTNTNDRQVIVSKPEKAAQGVATGILDYLKTTGQL